MNIEDFPPLLLGEVMQLLSSDDDLLAEMLDAEENEKWRNE